MVAPGCGSGAPLGGCHMIMSFDSRTYVRMFWAVAFPPSDEAARVYGGDLVASIGLPELMAAAGWEE